MTSVELPDDGVPVGVSASLVAVAAVGLVFGLATGVLLWASYPPAKHMAWVPAAISIGSAATIAGAYALLAFYLELRVTADWLVAGWLVAVLILAGAAVASETLALLRFHVPSAIGVKTGAVVRPNRPA
ncbi:MAG TPA: hypothetical protein VKW76_00625 [Candidatus Binatia bacterium]|nr:hypothetical protein [Candidatus Binatia bacterium]